MKRRSRGLEIACSASAILTASREISPAEKIQRRTPLPWNSSFSTVRVEDWKPSSLKESETALFPNFSVPGDLVSMRPMPRKLEA